MAKFALTLLFAFLAIFSDTSAAWIGNAADCPAESVTCPPGLQPTCFAQTALEASRECSYACGDLGADCDSGIKTCCISA
ncbi:uncharacterized protein BYT42DRAFT_165366 [Radiomyces spectabilis]|uniref:uncharacterized protein n=1 Tax=Radiomyces spectabilis TaxID=64574 RepID=UPI00221EACD3|nr:uncharacterized protein BYT42DRAFT_165366 [Radiomyces spectabilis]KAI8364680.1 hypothetical protein BYT42DRAFT_165366 [Radiomyces spectabilis]